MQKKSVAKNAGAMRVLIHFGFWVLIIQLMFDISGLYYSIREMNEPGSRFFDEAFVIIPLMIGLFYWNTEVLIPRFLNQKNWWKYLILLLLSFIFFLGIGTLFFLFLEKSNYQLHDGYEGIVDFLLQFLIIAMSVSTAVGISKIALEDREAKCRAIEQQKASEMKFLTTQVNPHFLFNSLNSIYSLAAEEDAPKTTEAILKLSEIMRYPLGEGSKKTVPISRKIQFLKDFIDLQKIKLGAEYPVTFEVEGNSEDIEIAPLLFISFVENAFKYGISRREPKPIFIKISTDENGIIFQCKNELVKSRTIESTQLGLKNVRERLRLIYDENYDLKIEDFNNIYQVNLKILNHF